MEKIEERLASIEEKLQGLIEINNRLVHENIRKSLVPVRQETVTETRITETDDTIRIETHTQNNFRVTGKTYQHRSLFREAKGEWNKVDLCWIFPNEHKEKLIELLRENNVSYKH